MKNSKKTKLDYLQKHRMYPRQIAEDPSERIAGIVVVPCYNEPDLLGLLECLWQCDRPVCDTEVIVVINASESSNDTVKTHNRESHQQAINWEKTHQDNALKFYFLQLDDFPEKYAGVGLARKIGMDEAVSRFNQAGNPNGVIVCLDADCRCDKNYLVAIEQHFQEHPDAVGCTIHFEHPLTGLDESLKNGIIHYELFLRYYLNGLRYAGYPNAMHTVGSCMAVRSSAYQRQGGMNKRKAGEDFYFLHKLINLGPITNLGRTTVYPGVRVSDRVPFGTGAALKKLSTNTDNPYRVYATDAFRNLKRLFECIEAIYKDKQFHLGNFSDFPEPLKVFLQQQQFVCRIDEIRTNTASLDSFVKRFYRWFDAFMILKYMHFVTPDWYPDILLRDAAAQLMSMSQGIELDSAANWDLEELLIFFRNYDKDYSID